MGDPNDWHKLLMSSLVPIMFLLALSDLVRALLQVVLLTATSIVDYNPSAPNSCKYVWQHAHESHPRGYYQVPSIQKLQGDSQTWFESTRETKLQEPRC
jgi:hypothetical protein